MPQLASYQRYEIYYLKKQGSINLVITNHIRVHSTTIKREIDCNSDATNGVYRPQLAQRKAELRHMNKPKSNRFTQVIKDFVVY